MNKHQRMDELLHRAIGCNDEKEQCQLLEQRGRICLSEAYIKRVKTAAKKATNDEEFLRNLGEVYPMLKREGDNVYVVYPKCYCHTRKTLKGDVPKYYCCCSVGWIKEMFEQALGRSVEVKLESSVLQGDKECRLRVFLYGIAIQTP